MMPWSGTSVHLVDARSGRRIFCRKRSSYMPGIFWLGLMRMLRKYEDCASYARVRSLQLL
jgi:hypothetical protein